MTNKIYRNIPAKDGKPRKLIIYNKEAYRRLVIKDSSLTDEELKQWEKEFDKYVEGTEYIFKDENKERLLVGKRYYDNDNKDLDIVYEQPVKEKTEQQIVQELFEKNLNEKLDVLQQQRVKVNPQSIEEEIAIFEASNLTRKELCHILAFTGKRVSDLSKYMLSTAKVIAERAGMELGQIPQEKQQPNTTNQNNQPN